MSSWFLMFRRVIASILIFALLGYGTVWAFGLPGSEIAYHALGDVHKNSPAALDEDACDHFCHAAAHMLGLAPPLPTVRFYPAANTFRPAPGGVLGALAAAPPLKPPRR